jgi:hypothetical protein
MPPFKHLYSSALDYELGTDDSTRLFTDARRKASINEGIEQFADLTECFQRESTVVSSHGVREYSLQSTVNISAGDFVRLAKQRPEYQHFSSGATATITYISGDNFERRDVEWLNTHEPGWRQSTAGTPRYYYERLDGGVRYFGLHPPPDIGSSETARVLVPYIAKPPVLTSDTDVPFSVASTAVGGSTGIRTDLDVYHQGIVHYAASKLEKLRVNEAGSQSQLQAFLGWVQRCVADRKPRGGQTIKHARRYFEESRRGGTGDGLPRPMSGWNYGG